MTISQWLALLLVEYVGVIILCRCKETLDEFRNLEVTEEVEEGRGEGFTDHNDPEVGNNRWGYDVEERNIDVYDENKDGEKEDNEDVECDNVDNNDEKEAFTHVLGT